MHQHTQKLLALHCTACPTHGDVRGRAHHPCAHHPCCSMRACPVQERFYFGDAVLPLFESGVPLLLERLRQLPDKDNVRDGGGVEWGGEKWAGLAFRPAINSHSSQHSHTKHTANQHVWGTTVGRGEVVSMLCPAVTHSATVPNMCPTCCACAHPADHCLP